MQREISIIWSINEPAMNARYYLTLESERRLESNPSDSPTYHIINIVRERVGEECERGLTYLILEGSAHLTINTPIRNLRHQKGCQFGHHLNVIDLHTNGEATQRFALARCHLGCGEGPSILHLGPVQHVDWSRRASSEGWSSREVALNRNN